MPTIYPMIGGVAGKGHGSDFSITDPDSACIKPAKIMLLIIRSLLKDNAQQARQVLEEYQPSFGSVREFFDYMDRMTADGQGVEYSPDGTVVLHP